MMRSSNAGSRGRPRRGGTVFMSAQITTLAVSEYVRSARSRDKAAHIGCTTFRYERLCIRESRGYVQVLGSYLGPGRSCGEHA
jgi:hypothetical protein